MSKGPVTSDCSISPERPSTWHMLFSKPLHGTHTFLSGVSAEQRDFSWARVPIQPRCCAEAWLRSGAAEPSVGGGPAASHWQMLLLLAIKSGRKLPGPRFPSPNGVTEFHQSYRDVSYFSSITKATFKSLTDIFIGTGYKD